jgi:hypothetical protein
MFSSAWPVRGPRPVARVQKEQPLVAIAEPGADRQGTDLGHGGVENLAMLKRLPCVVLNCGYIVVNAEGAHWPVSFTAATMAATTLGWSMSSLSVHAHARPLFPPRPMSALACSYHSSDTSTAAGFS